VSIFSIVPSEAPRNVLLYDVTSNSVTLSWDPPSPRNQNGQITYYHVIIAVTEVQYLGKGGFIFSMGGNMIERYDVSEGRVQTIHLHPSYRYSISIAAATSAGIGNYSQMMEVTLLEDG